MTGGDGREGREGEFDDWLEKTSHTSQTPYAAPAHGTSGGRAASKEYLSVSHRGTTSDSTRKGGRRNPTINRVAFRRNRVSDSTSRASKIVAADLRRRELDVRRIRAESSERLCWESRESRRSRFKEERDGSQTHSSCTVYREETEHNVCPQWCKKSRWGKERGEYTA